MLQKDKPDLLVASPPCTVFSIIQNLNKKYCAEEVRQAIAMVDFAVELCIIQHRAGRKFVFEHPATSRAWMLPSLQSLSQLDGLYSVDFDQCMFGQTVMTPDGQKGLAKKRTRIYTNSGVIDKLLDKQCSGYHEHTVLLNNLAVQASVYPVAMCDAFIDGILMETEQVKDVLYEFEGMCDAEEEHMLRSEVVGVDDVSGKEIDPKLIAEARQEEMDGFKKHHVYHYVARAKAVTDPEGKFIGVRWVDVNKGTDEVPNVRSRLVGQEYAVGPRRDELYAPTPPLAAARMLLSLCASRGVCGPGDWRILLLDIKKAFLYGKMSRHVYIELPSEDPMSEGGQMVGMLDKAMYGTRDAPVEWQNEVGKTMMGIGFVAVRSTPCLYFHPTMNLYVVIHVDDVMAIGSKANIKEFLKEIEKKYEVTAEIIGPEEGRGNAATCCGNAVGSVRSGKFLGRTVCWRSDGLTWTGDSKMAQVSVEEWQLANGKGVETPGTVDDCEEESEELMGKEAAAFYRRTAARLNYASLDNPCIAFAAKEASRTMSAPRICDEAKVKRILRYLLAYPVATYLYAWQAAPLSLEGFSDSDWAGCRRTRRSTSGGVILHGTHLIHHWSRTQSGIALSSAEAELNAILKMGQETLGIGQFLHEMGIEKTININADSSAAKGILCRKGSGKVKHLEVRQLWLQEKVTDGKVTILKIPRRLNSSDALTHHWTKAENGEHFKNMGIQ